MMRLLYTLCFGALAVLLPRSGFGQTVADSFNDTSRINPAASSGYALLDGTLRSYIGIDLGTGADGPCSLSGYLNLSTGSCVGRGQPDAVSFSVTANVAANQANVPLTSVPTGLTAGDEVLIINLINPWGNAATVGQYETHRILSISGTTLTLDANLTHAYDGRTNRIMVQRVPNYTSVSLTSSATLYATGFNGNLGGVIFFRARAEVTVDGSITMSALGYRGGMPNSPAWNGGYRGEGPNTAYGSWQTYAQAFGAGGGGDADQCLAGQGGGGGGHGSWGSMGGALWLTCRDTSEKWFFGKRTAEGGSTLGTEDLSDLFMGPGGGSGGIDGDNPGSGGAGGAGGGIIVIAAQSVTVNGNIRSDGARGSTGYGETGGGGGGAGGSILLQAHSLNLGSSRVTAWWGLGGDSSENSGNYGGGGGVGRIAVRSLLPPSGSTAPSALRKTLSYSPVTVTSTNLLAGTGSLGSINTFSYNLSSLPPGSTASVKFSQNGVDWYNHLNQPGQSSTLTAGSAQRLSLEALGWLGASFYYRLELGPAPADTPVLENVSVAYCSRGFGNACDPDSDSDGILDPADNCTMTPNPDQRDTDGDAQGDVCDEDDDNDTVPDSNDNCVLVANRDQKDSDADGTGDLCDGDADGDGLSNDTEQQLGTNTLSVDTDGDGIPDALEVGNPNAPCDTDGDGQIDALDEDSDEDGTPDQVERGDGTSPADTDGDTIPDYRDTDSDADGVHDRTDNCRLIINASQENLDQDSQGDACDSEMDGDGVANEREVELGTDPGNPDSDGDSILDGLELGTGPLPLDSDGDGTLNALDTDSDQDGVPDQEENAGVGPGILLDSDGDGRPDYVDTDSDNDGVLDLSDSCRLGSNSSQADMDRDGTGDACDADIDGDGLANNHETRFGLDALNTDSDHDGITDSQEFGDGPEPIDTDGDTTVDALDEDSDGDGVSDAEERGAPGKPVDTDQDGRPDYIDDDSDDDTLKDGQDNCRLAANADQQDMDRDASGDVCDGDLDGDTVADERDNCPRLANPDQLNTDANAHGDACDPDDDGDSVADESDNCPLVFNTEQQDIDKDGIGNACDSYDDAQMMGGAYACTVGDGSAASLAPLLGLLLAALWARRSRPRAS